ncbi:MAG TPA: thioesterase family protein [Steroidobacteraceae bacterium]|jgi:acyl-CoA thioester hydrolase
MTATELPKYRAVIRPEWIDFNGHVRDAYYTLVASYAIDDFMDHVGLDAEYRARTQCTLYTLELHIHYLREVKQSDDLCVVSQVLDADRKRIHLACRLECARLQSEPAATADFMLMHVHQGEQVRAANFPEQVLAKLNEFKAAAAAQEPFGPLSRPIAIKRS